MGTLQEYKAKRMRDPKFAEAYAEAVRERESKHDALAYIDSLLPPEEIWESDLRVSLIHEIIEARKEKGISQKKLEELSGVKELPHGNRKSNRGK